MTRCLERPLLGVVHFQELVEVVLAPASLAHLLPVVEMLWLVLPYFVPQDVSLDVAVAVGPSCSVTRGSYLLAAAIHYVLAWKF